MFSKNPKCFRNGLAQEFFQLAGFHDLASIMANAPESLVASLCFVHVVISTGLVAVAWACAGGQTT